MTTSIVRIVGRHLPGRVSGPHRNVHLGVQRRREVVDLVPADVLQAVFDVPIDVLLDPTHGMDYRGPFAQGPRGQRFIYLSWGEVADDGSFTMFRRAKLNLFRVPEQIAAALAAQSPVRAELDLTDPKGGPLCASISPQMISWSVGAA
jgi:hypothetical protein